MSKPIALYYEQPHWFAPLFAELERRGLAYVKLHAAAHTFSIEDHPEEHYSLVVNRMSPSAWNRGHGDAIFYTLGYLDHLARRGVRVINGREAYQVELSKAAQLSLLDSLGLSYPKSRVIHRAAQALAATDGLRWPVVLKPNIGGSGAGVRRFDSPDELARAADAGELQFGLDSTALVQEFIPARGACIVRCEVLNGRFLYAIKVHITGETFDLCPADICRTTAGVALDRTACAVDAPKSGISVEGYEPSPEIISDVERIMAAAGIELGGVEYIVDERASLDDTPHHEGHPIYYDMNALSNFVADGERVVGFNPFVRLVDWLEVEAARVNEAEWNAEHAPHAAGQAR